MRQGQPTYPLQKSMEMLQFIAKTYSDTNSKQLNDRKNDRMK